MAFISIVVPTYNEESNINVLYERLVKVFQNQSDLEFELIFADDSTDTTPILIKELNLRDSRVKMIHLTRKFGQSVAIAAGLKVSKGDAVVMMDADLQDPPETIPLLLKEWVNGNKVVYVKRNSLSNSLVYKFAAKVFYRLLNKISYINIPIDAGEFRLLDRSVVDFMNNLKEHSRFIRGLTVWPGFKSTTVSITRSSRLYGETKYNFKRSFAVAVDGFVSFSVVPLRISSFLGLVMSVLSMLAGSIYFLCWLFNVVQFGTGWMSIFLLILLLGGLNMLFIGVIGEYIGRCFTELQDRPLYLVDYTIGIE